MYDQMPLKSERLSLERQGAGPQTGQPKVCHCRSRSRREQNPLGFRQPPRLKRMELSLPHKSATLDFPYCTKPKVYSVHLISLSYGNEHFHKHFMMPLLT